ncbi:ubiquitin-like-specific protease 1D isoform X1 [Zingiber officinale]|uniref:ubiquitin-like-specific protease 1D isoform X1 n=1 Tax=Zingiber officinale TaxID=94328 RepID=UPI001C4C9EE5|nr:ubiquitin-like-specific protease 1D isoform X1 [Zingiber officinale]
MAKQPIKIDWEAILPETRDNGPSLEVEVVPVAPLQGSEVASFSDHSLLGPIQRVKKLLASEVGQRLSDGGAKLKASLCQMEAERDRRNRARDPKDAGGCSTITQSKNTESPVKDHNENPIQSTFAAKFLEKLEGKADAAFDEDLKVINQRKDIGSRKNVLQKNGRGHHFIITSQKTKHSSKQTPFKHVGRFVKLSSLSADHGDPCSSSRLKENYFNYKRKRMNAPSIKGRNSVATRLQKQVSEVVLLDEEETHPVQPTEDNSDNWTVVSVYYPSRDDPESVELSYTDIACLEPKSYLTSSIMNFYIRYLQMPLSLVDRPKGYYHFFNTYFYKKLEEAISPKASKQCFEKLRRWWKGVDIFQKSYIFIPVHRDMHWSLVIICIPAKEDESGPIVLHLDSLGIHNSYLIFEVIERCRYLKEEWSYMIQNSPPQDPPFSDKIWKNFSRRVDRKVITVPQQKNEYDCGLFVLYFMEKFIEDAPERFRRKYLHSMFGSKWFKPEEASGLRSRIRGLVLEVFGCAMHENDKAKPPAYSCEPPEDDCLQ